MGVLTLEIFLILQCGDRFYTAESDVYRRQILTSKVNPRAVRAKDLDNYDNYMLIHFNTLTSYDIS